MSWSTVSAQDLAPQRWKNGGGWTRELLAWPRPDQWLLRISVADIEADGPFSAFPGIDRWFGVLQGGGVELLGRELRCGDGLLAFDGALAPDCRLLDGMTRDFNLMHRRGRGRVEVVPADRALLPEGVQWLGLFTAWDGVLSHGGRSMNLAPMSLAWCEAPVAQRCAFNSPTPGTAWWLVLKDDAGEQA
ncbi:HutD/Ves family protein [Roseateles cavernae]|uniref:HutD/Ves family protein n=1 Tax=Roseateles cavernae TaxID=3153578 RepID=UPI0032E45462